MDITFPYINNGEFLWQGPFSSIKFGVFFYGYYFFFFNKKIRFIDP